MGTDKRRRGFFGGGGAQLAVNQAEKDASKYK